MLIGRLENSNESVAKNRKVQYKQSERIFFRETHFQESMFLMGETQFQELVFLMEYPQ